MIEIRQARTGDANAIWSMLEPVIRAGETYSFARDCTREEALPFWFGEAHATFVAEENGAVVGTYWMRPNQPGGGAHVANCAYVTANTAQGRGVARAMLEHSLELAKARGYRSMQFNFVIATNTRAVKLWESYGFKTVGRLPEAFEHPSQGYVDVLVMHREL